MSRGYDQPLYLLPFDHRDSYVTGMFDFEPPLTTDQHAAVTDTKQLIYDGFRQTLGRGALMASAGILADEQFGANILCDAKRSGYVTALAIEKSDSEEFEFEYGEAFAEHIEAFAPTFAKVLVRYNPEGDAALNRRQTDRLKQLSDYCRAAGQLFMLELLVPATRAQMERVREDQNAYHLQIRPALTLRTICAFQDAGVEPDVWKVEGNDRSEDCERVVDIAQRGGRHAVGCVVLGRAANRRKVAHWLATAASVQGFIGFSIGRTTFWDAVADYQARTVTRQQAVLRIAERFTEWAAIFERAQRASAAG